MPFVSDKILKIFEVWKTVYAFLHRHIDQLLQGTLSYLILLPGWAGSYTCPSLRPY